MGTLHVTAEHRHLGR